MKNKGFVYQIDILQMIARALCLISPQYIHSHEKMAYLAYRLSESFMFTKKQVNDVVYAALLQDISTFDKTDHAEKRKEITQKNDPVEITMRMLGRFPGYKDVIEILKNGALSWEKLQDQELPDTLRWQAQILHAVNDIVAMLPEKGTVLNGLSKIREYATAGKGKLCKELSGALEKLSGMPYVWLEMSYAPEMVYEKMVGDDMFTATETLHMAHVMSLLVDFKSPFTVEHSAGVEAVAEYLAKIAGMDEMDCLKMAISGSLHDLGKLAVPNDIIDKPGRLTEEEFNEVKPHAFYTYRILKQIRNFEDIAEWAGYHHEKINGKGYPFGICGDALPQGSRIMAVADIFSALTEDRPYRKGMEKEKVVTILTEMVQDGSLDGSIVTMAKDHYDELAQIRKKLAVLRP